MAADNPLNTTVGDYVTLVRGTTYKGQLVGKPGPALLGLGSIEPGGGFRIDNYKTYGGDCPDELMLTSGDIFASLKGATKDGKMIGSVARVPPSVRAGRLTQDTVKLVFRSAHLDDQSYLYWILRSPQYREYCAGHATGSAVVALSRHDFLSYSVPPPTPPRMTAVALLDAIEEKIDICRNLSKTLEAMSRSLFRSWFVEFEPVRAKAEGREPGLPGDIADLFPDSFSVDGIPATWRMLGLDEIANFLNGLALQKFPPQPGVPTIPVIKIAQLRAGHSIGADRASASLPRNYVIEDGDIIFSWSGTLECEIWAGGQGALNQHLFKVSGKLMPSWFAYLAVREHLPSFRHIAASKATTMGHIQRHHLHDAKIVVPSEGLVDVANSIIGPIVEASWSHRVQCSSLVALRETVLSKLVSGELRANAAESDLEATA